MLKVFPCVGSWRDVCFVCGNLTEKQSDFRENTWFGDSSVSFQDDYPNAAQRTPQQLRREQSYENSRFYSSETTANRDFDISCTRGTVPDSSAFCKLCL